MTNYQQTTIHIDASRALEGTPTGVNVYAREIIEHLAVGAVAKEAKIILYAPAWSRGAVAQVFPNLPATVSWKFLAWPPKFLWTQIRLATAWWVAARAGNFETKFAKNIFFAPAHVAPWWSPKNLVVVVHDVAFVTVPEAYSFAECAFAKLLTRRNCAQATHIITPSVSTEQDLQKYFGVNAEKIFITPYAAPRHVARAEVAEKDTEENSAQNFEIAEPIILFVGRIEYKKGIDRLVSAFEQMKISARLILVGKPGIGYDKMNACIVASPKRNQIIERGFVSDEELNQLYQNAAVFVLPSRAEGFGFILLEAFQRRVPTVAWNTGSIPEVAGNAAALVTDTTTCAAALDKVISDASFADALRAAGQVRAAEFSWEKTAAETWRIILEAGK